jgi:hypothetical protein
MLYDRNVIRDAVRGHALAPDVAVIQLFPVVGVPISSGEQLVFSAEGGNNVTTRATTRL